MTSSGMAADQSVQIDRLLKEINVQNAINAFLKQSLSAANARELLEGALALFPPLAFLGVEDKGAAFLVAEHRSELVMVAHRNMSSTLLTLCSRVPFGHCLCGRAAQEGEIQFASCIDERHDTRFEGMQPHGHYNVPIKVGGKVVGVIVLYLRPHASKNLECIQFLEVASTIVAGALKRLESEEKIRCSEQLTRRIIEFVPCGIVVADARGAIQIFNKAAERFFGYRREDITGRSIGELVPPAMREAHETGFQRFRATGQSRILGLPPFEAEALRKDGALFPIRLAIDRMPVQGGESFVGMISDITEEKRLYSELIQSEKMAGLGNMVAGVAHEINTPVGIGVTAASELEERTRDFSRLVQGEGISEEELNDFLASTGRLAALIRGNLERAADLVRSFKSVAVDQSSEKLRLFKVRDYVESAVLTLHHELRNTRIAVTVLCPHDLEIRSNPGALSQIVINLVNNSRIHAFGPEDAGQIVMEFTVEKERLHFLYRDNGCGMTEETCRRIFEPFYTTRRDLGGSGLGMHIVYNLATQTLGGSITCHSLPGNGMSVLIDMPLVR
ncbi:MAG: PAS domain-containing sensor histidine kinase [Magnetococcales bacterium]|nr:PAS domain-containing sensor histidine kinase [Magnetococcales bacterium]